MSEIKKYGEPLDEMDLEKAVGGVDPNEKYEFLCKNCKKTVMAKNKPPVCPNCGKSM